MKQVRLVVFKGIWALWPQLSLYAVLLAAFAWTVPQTWPGNAPNSFLAVFVTLLKILLGLSQFVLVAERKRQRPCHWLSPADERIRSCFATD
jgi:hypothetical protein